MNHDVAVGFQSGADHMSGFQLSSQPTLLGMRTRYILSCRTGAVLNSVDYVRGRVQSAIHAGL